MIVLLVHKNITLVFHKVESFAILYRIGSQKVAQ